MVVRFSENLCRNLPSQWNKKTINRCFWKILANFFWEGKILANLTCGPELSTLDSAISQKKKKKKNSHISFLIFWTSRSFESLRYENKIHLLDIFARRFVDIIFRGLRNNWKILSTMKKKTRVTFLRKCPFVRQVQNFDQNAMLAFLHRNL